jgi:predicted CoA-binding protein
MKDDKSAIAVVGASGDRAKFGNKCVRAYIEAGWEVYPVHPRESEIEGLPVFAKLADVPVELERISVYLHPDVVMQVIPEMVGKGAQEVWFNPGSADHRVLAAARSAGLAAVDGCSIVDIGLSPLQFP